MGLTLCGRRWWFGGGQGLDAGDAVAELGLGGAQLGEGGGEVGEFLVQLVFEGGEGGEGEGGEVDCFPWLRGFTFAMGRN